MAVFKKLSKEERDAAFEARLKALSEDPERVTALMEELKVTLENMEARFSTEDTQLSKSRAVDARVITEYMASLNKNN